MIRPRSGWRPRFRSLSTRLAVLYAGLFAAALVLVAGAAQLVIERTARASIAAELASSGTVYDRLWALREASLAGAVDILSHDFGFRSAIASSDHATIGSALASLRVRAGVPVAMVIDQDGDVIGAEGPVAAAAAQLPSVMAEGRRDAVLPVGNVVYRFVLAPVLAPMEIGWVVLATPLGEQEMRALERLSAVPLNATMLRRTAGGRWIAVDGSIPPQPALVAASRSARPLARIRLGKGEALALAKPLDGTGGTPEAALLIHYSYRLAFAPYRPFQIGVVLAGLASLLLVVWGSIRLARTIARPLAALDAAALALEEGARTEVTVEGRDEIARLATSFNRMSAGIVEREHRISHLAFHDTLTGLPNRVAFRETLDQAIGRALRAGEPLAILCIDLDGFKGVNDTLGHPVGDALLRQVGVRLVDLLPDAQVCRLGGDEFAIVLAGHADPDRPRAAAQQIADVFAEPILTEGHQIATGASIGIAVVPVDGRDPDELLKNADLALYRAKQDGRGVFRFFEPALDEAARRRRQLELDLRRALKAGEFELHFQPIYHLHSDRIGGFEALLRWHHPSRGMVSPVEFIPVAEETGLIVAIGAWVMHEACRAAMRWPEDVRVAVNVSTLQFRSPGFQSIVLQALSRSGLPPRRLEIEITESVFLEGEQTVLTLLHGLRAMGVRIALDDFGTGYSSLSYLRSFPFDKIKIDRSFVSPVADDSSAAAIVRAIVDLATALHMETTAEGVETEAQLARLRSQGCSSIQGYLFSRPLQASHADALVATAGVRVA
ncbi:MAG: EAL domain-containing protein [Sphingomonas sp.]